MNLRKLTALCLCIFLLPYQSFAQQPAPKKFDLTVDSIMRGPDLVGYAPSGVYWSRDSQRIYFRWKRAGEPRLKQPDLYVVNRDGSLTCLLRTVPGARIQLERADALGAWVVLPGSFVVPDGQASLVLPRPSSARSGFYRAVRLE